MSRPGIWVSSKQFGCLNEKCGCLDETFGCPDDKFGCLDEKLYFGANIVLKF